MSFSARRLAGFLSLPLIAVCLAPTFAAAQERCSGTLCDWYYGSSPPPAPETPAKPAAPTPLMVPKGGILGMFSGNGAAQGGAAGQAGQAPAARPIVGVGGGGLAAMARGEKQDRCSGSLCDLYYGGPAPEAPAGQTAAVAPDHGASATSDAATSEPAADVAPQTTRRARGRAADAQAGVRYEAPRCAASGRDPWACYR